MDNINEEVLRIKTMMGLINEEIISEGIFDTFLAGAIKRTLNVVEHAALEKFLIGQLKNLTKQEKQELKTLMSSAKGDSIIKSLEDMAKSETDLSITNAINSKISKLKKLKEGIQSVEQVVTKTPQQIEKETQEIMKELSADRRFQELFSTMFSSYTNKIEVEKVKTFVAELLASKSPKEIEEMTLKKCGDLEKIIKENPKLPNKEIEKIKSLINKLKEQIYVKKPNGKTDYWESSKRAALGWVPIGVIYYVTMFLYCYFTGGKDCSTYPMDVFKSKKQIDKPEDNSKTIESDKDELQQTNKKKIFVPGKGVIEDPNQ
jgi:hypothetical protein